MEIEDISPRIADHMHQLAWSAADLIINEDTPLQSANGIVYDAVVKRVEDLMATAFLLGRGCQVKTVDD